MRVFRLIVFFVFLFSFLSHAEALDGKEYVTFSACVDGDTAKFHLNQEVITVRFLAIDTPEFTTKKEVWGKEASVFTCDYLKKAKLIELEYDVNSNQFDKYHRTLAWIWVDGYLLQDELIKAGLGRVAYLYGDYKYTNVLKEHESNAKKNKVNIWSDKTSPVETNASMNDPYYYLLLILFGMSAFLSNYYSTNKNNRVFICKIHELKLRKEYYLLIYFLYTILIVPVIYDFIFFFQQMMMSKRKVVKFNKREDSHER